MPFSVAKPTRVELLIETANEFGRVVGWYCRQKKVRRNLFRHPVYVLSDLWKRSARKAEWSLAFERLNRSGRVDALQRLWSELA